MPFIPVANAVRVEVRMLLDEQHIENTLWFHKTSAIGNGDVAALLTDVMAFWIAHQFVQCSSSVQLLEVYGRDFTNSFGYEDVVTPGSPAFGGYASAPGSNNQAFCLKFGTGLAGRGNRGRNFFGGLVKAEVTGNQIGASYADDIRDAYAAMMGPATVHAGWQWVVTSLYLGGVPRVAGQTLNVSQVTYTDRIIDSQRRRLPGRGR